MQEDETMSSEASEEESHSASGGVGVDEEVSDSSNNNTMREEDRLRLKAPIWNLMRIVIVTRRIIVGELSLVSQ